jgi:tetratricopeptide (TPR) repeat protein
VLELDPRSRFGSGSAARLYYQLGDYENARALATAALERDPTDVGAHAQLGLVRVARGDYEGAIQEFQIAEKLGRGAPQQRALLAYGHAAGGYREAAQRGVAALVESRDSAWVSGVMLAQVYLALADEESALEWLEVALRERDVRAAHLPPVFGTLRREALRAASLTAR